MDEQTSPVTTTPGISPPPRWEDREAALKVLDDALQWVHLNPACWRQLDEQVEAMSAALAEADWKAATAAVTELELMAPCRCPCRRAADAVPTPRATATAVGELTKKIEANPCLTGETAKGDTR